MGEHKLLTYLLTYLLNLKRHRSRYWRNYNLYFTVNAHPHAVMQVYCLYVSMYLRYRAMQRVNIVSLQVGTFRSRFPHKKVNIKWASWICLLCRAVFSSKRHAIRLISDGCLHVAREARRTSSNKTEIKQNCQRSAVSFQPIPPAALFNCRFISYVRTSLKQNTHHRKVVGSIPTNAVCFTVVS